MIIQLGNPKPTHGGEATVTFINIDDTVAVADEIDVKEVLSQLFRGSVTNLPNCEALLAIISPNGAWRAHSFADSPTWVWSDNEKLQNQLCAVYGCPVSTHVNIEDYN